MKPQMSSTKPAAQRRAITRWGVIITALAVLAAGCSQSEDGVSDVSGSATSTSPASLSSAASLSPAVENTATSTSLSELSTTTTQASVEEEPSGSGSEITTTTTSLSPAVVEGSLSDEAIRLIDVATDACADLLELRCADAMRDVCFQLRYDLGSEQPVERSDDNTILTESEQSDICALDSIFHLWEIDTVLSAKYGDEYYRWNPGFLAFRDEFHSAARSFLASNSDLFALTGGRYNWIFYSFENIEEIGSFDEFVDGSSWGKYLPYDIRFKLLRIFYDFGLALQFELDNLSAKNEDIASKILSIPNFAEAHRECDEWEIDGLIIMSLSQLFTSETIQRWKVLECIDNLCENRTAADAVSCYFEDSDIDEFSNGRIVLRGRSATVSGFFWNSIKYFCAKSTTNDGVFPNDTCHRVAANICQLTSELALNKAADSTSNLIISSSVLRSACRLGLALHYQTYMNARTRCYSEIKNLLMTMDWLSAQNSSCNDAAVKCAELWLKGNYGTIDYPWDATIYYPYDWCSFFRQYYDFEIFWQKIPLICSENNTSSSTFADSRCYNSIHEFCSSRYGKNDFDIYESNDLENEYGNLMRGGEKIRGALCKGILNVQTRVPVESNSSHRDLNLTSRKSQKQLISLPNRSPLARTSKKELAVGLTDDNIENISSAVKRCTNNSSAMSETECVKELWKSCFDLLSYRISPQRQYFDEYYNVYGPQEFWNSITYICNAAWIAELARMASVLSTSFPKNYQAGSFNQFLQYIADEAVDRGEGIIAIDENGTARPNLNREGLSSEVTENLTALGMSIVQLVQPYLAAANNQTRQSTA